MTKGIQNRKPGLGDLREHSMAHQGWHTKKSTRLGWSKWTLNGTLGRIQINHAWSVLWWTYLTIGIWSIFPIVHGLTELSKNTLNEISWSYSPSMWPHWAICDGLVIKAVLAPGILQTGWGVALQSSLFIGSGLVTFSFEKGFGELILLFYWSARFSLLSVSSKLYYF